MIFKKTVLAKTEYPPYAVCVSKFDGQTAYISAPGGHGDALIFKAPDFNPEPMWGTSGTMSIVPDPDFDDCKKLYVTREFYPGTNAPGTYIMCADYNPQINPPWDCRQIVKKPFIHRHDVIRVGNSKFLILCNLSEWKENKEDWSKPGGIYVAKFQNDGTLSEVQTLYYGITKNHGFHKTTWDGCEALFITGSEGAFVVKLIGEDPLKWPIEKILDGEISEACNFDIDFDGEEELAIIEQFHGSTLSIMKRIDNKWTKVFTYENLERCHAIWGGNIAGKPVFLVGNMAGTKQLLSMSYLEGSNKFSMEISEIDAGGPSNFTVFRENNRDYILSANWAANEVALYEAMDTK